MKTPTLATPPPPPTTPGAADPASVAHVRLLAINDLHGQLTDSPETLGAAKIGGVATLAGYVNRERASAPGGSALVVVGDAFGGSQPESTLLGHQSTLAVLDRMGVNVATVGNHEFDGGPAKMHTLLQGGEPALVNADGTIAKAGSTWKGTSFPWISANVIDAKTGEALLPAYEIETIDGVQVAFVGADTASLKSVTTHSATAGVDVLDPAAAINKVVPELQARGVHTIVAVVHEGGALDAKTHQLTGPIADIAKRLDPDVDVVLSAHTHTRYLARVNGKLVTQSLAYGKALTEVDLLVDRASDQVLDARGHTLINDESGVAPDAGIAKLVAGFTAAIAPVTSRAVGTLAEPLPRRAGAGGESELGLLIADSQRAFAKADVALVNPTGIRADLPAGTVTYGDVFAVEPFQTPLVTARMTGAELKAALEQMFRDPARKEILQVSGLRATYDPDRPLGSRIVSLTTPQGAALVDGASYSVVMNEFLADGGDGFTRLGSARRTGEAGTDVDALVAYLQAAQQPPDRDEHRVVATAGAPAVSTGPVTGS